MRLYSDLNRAADAESQNPRHYNIRPNPSTTQNGNSHPPPSQAEADVFGQPMELDEPIGASNGNEGDRIGNENGTGGGDEWDDRMDTMMDESEAAAKAVQQQTESIKYGALLKEEFGDEGPEVHRMLNEGFGMYAYADPWESPFARLLDEGGRAAVAEELNSAILGTFLF